MGFFSRLFGKEPSVLTPRDSDVVVPERRWPQARLSSREPAREALAYYLVSDSMTAVVGESYYQAALRRAVGGKSSENGIPVQACLQRDPRNKYDKNAVRVSVDGETAGYVSRDLAPHLQPRLEAIESRGMVATCDARVLGGSRSKPSYGIVLHCSTALNGFSNDRPDHLVMLSGSWMTAVTGEEHHQQVLEPYALQGAGVSYVYATLGWCDVATGKYKGARAIEVRVDGQRVGQLTRAMTERYEADVEQTGSHEGVRTGVTAVLMRKSRIEVSLLMPQHR